MGDGRVVASVRTKLVTASKRVGMSNELLMRRFAFERLLSRLGASEFRDRLCLKGAMAFLAVTGDAGRPTRDMDFSGLQGETPQECLATWRAIAGRRVGADDGIDFDVDSFQVETINAESEEPGNRITGVARLGTSKIPIKIEVSYGNALTPGAVLMDYPNVLPEYETGKVLCYSKETILAEKFEAVCALGERNSRFKDFYDLRGLARGADFDADVAADAFRNTFGRRGTPLPEVDPVAFDAGFVDYGEKGWQAFQRKQGIKDPQSFAELVSEIRPLLMGVAGYARGGEPPGAWSRGQGWNGGPIPTDEREFVPFS